MLGLTFSGQRRENEVFPYTLHQIEEWLSVREVSVAATSVVPLHLGETPKQNT